MGPQAGGYLYNTLMNMAVREYGARSNDSFPEVILHSIPVPDFISSDKNKGRALTMLKKRIRKMGRLNVAYLSIACNTAHVLMNELRIIENIVRNILQGKVSLADGKKLMVIANYLRQKGAQVIILGCTELPLVFPSKYGLPIYNSVEILARALLQKYYKQNTIRQ